MKKGIIIQILTYAIPIIVVLYILNVVLKRMGLIQSGREKRNTREEKAGAKEIVTTDYLKSDYHKGKSFTPMADSLLKKYAKQLGAALRFWGTDEPLVFSTFKSLSNKMNVSQVSEMYYKIYQEDLRAALVNDLNNEDLATVNEIIDSLPKR